MERPDPTMFTLQRLVSDLTKVERNHHTLGSEASENDVEHSYGVALLGWYICEKLQLGLDVGKVLKYALVHDFVEVYAGDVNTYASAEDREKKAEDEAVALERLGGELAGFPGIVSAMQKYEDRADEEALFVWTVDKMQAMILADLDDWRPYKKINITYESFQQKHGEQLKACSPHCEEIFGELLEYCKTTYYDNPANKKPV